MSTAHRIVLVGCVLAIGVAMHLASRRRLGRFWRRPCAGRPWRRAFPKASKVEMREFLKLFVDAFALPRKWSLSFRPDDRVMDVYRTIYHWGGCDALELETLQIMVEERYGASLIATWDPAVTTLGDVFQQAMASSRPV